MHKKQYPPSFISAEFSFRKGQNVHMVLSQYRVPEEAFTQCIYFREQATEYLQHHLVIQQYGRALFPPFCLI